MRSCLIPEKKTLRPVKSVAPVPIRKSTAELIRMLASTAVVPDTKKKGNTGNRAPVAKKRKDDVAACHA